MEKGPAQTADTSLDERLFVLSPDEHDAFVRVLENPPPPNARLKKLMSGKSPWEI